MLLEIPLQQAAEIATVLIVAVAIIGIVPVVQTLRVARLSYKLSVADRVIQMLERDRENRRLLDKMTPPFARGDFEALPVSEQQGLDQLARTYDQVGLLVMHHLIPLDLLFDFYSRPVVVAWNRLASHVKHERGRRPQRGHMEKFEFLAVAAKLYRDATHPGEETFVVTRDQLDRWTEAFPADLRRYISRLKKMDVRTISPNSPVAEAPADSSTRSTP